MIRNLVQKILHDSGRRVLKFVSYEQEIAPGKWQAADREVYDTGDAACILLYEPEKRSIILTRQFRLPAFLNNYGDGKLTEACAGKLDGEDPLTCIIREAAEETGYVISGAQKIAEAFVGPGAITEKVHFFIAPYHAEMKTAKGGGLAHEGEHIEVLEMSLADAEQLMNELRINDAKTLVLLQYALLHREKLFTGA